MEASKGGIMAAGWISSSRVPELAEAALDRDSLDWLRLIRSRRIGAVTFH